MDAPKEERKPDFVLTLKQYIDNEPVTYVTTSVYGVTWDVVKEAFDGLLGAAGFVLPKED